jgi:hypothetical protein
VTADRLALATRTNQRARRTSTCSSCRAVILPGMAMVVLDRYREVLRAQQAAGDPHARWRLHILWWARHDIEQWGMDEISRLRLVGYVREVERLAG